MTNHTTDWREIRSKIVTDVGGEAAIARAHKRNQAYVDAHRLAERRESERLTQEQVARRMGVTKSRVSQIERGEISTVDVIARYVHALGGNLQISAVFGDDRMILSSTSTDAA